MKFIVITDNGVRPDDFSSFWPTQILDINGTIVACADNFPGALICGGAIVPVFRNGELIVVNDLGAEPFGICRTPEQHNVSFEMYDDLDIAADRAHEITEAFINGLKIDDSAFTAAAVKIHTREERKGVSAPGLSPKPPQEPPPQFHVKA